MFILTYLSLGGKSSVTGIDNHIYSNPPLSMHVDDDPQGDGGVYEDNNVVPEAEEPSKVDDIYGNLEPPAPIKISEFPEYIVNNSDNLEHEFLVRCQIYIFRDWCNCVCKSSVMQMGSVI